ncbi:MAG: hypothetical protein IPK67_00850 [Planctomycetes bacterium]|nr:hypothetical protein [Planctomycetota bacterium]
MLDALAVVHGALGQLDVEALRGEAHEAVDAEAAGEARRGAHIHGAGEQREVHVDVAVEALPAEGDHVGRHHLLIEVALGAADLHVQ